MATAKGPAKNQYVRHDVPEGEVIASGSGTRAHVLRTLSPSECFDLIEPGGVGRVGFASADGIMMLPVNFAVSRKTIVFRTAPDTLLAVYANGQVSFEADHFDEALHTGWSVLVSGRAHVAAPDGTVPADPAGWGWRSDDKGDWRARGDRIGWLDGEDLYLEPEAAEFLVQEQGCQHTDHHLGCDRDDGEFGRR